MDGAGWIGITSLVGDAFRWRFLWPSLGLVGALLFGAAFLYLLDRWRKRPGSEGLTAGDQLTHFRDLFDRGLISRTEYERIRGQLASDLRRELKLETPDVPVEIRPEDTLPDPPPRDPDVPPDGIKPAG